MSELEQFAQVTQKEWAIMSESLRSLTKNLANEWITHFLSKSLIRSLFGKNKVSLEIRWENSQQRKARNEEKFKNNLLGKNSFRHFLKTKYTTELNFLFSLWLLFFDL